MPPKSKNSRGSSQKGSTNNADAIRKMYATTSIASTKVVEEKSQEPQLNEEKLNPKQSENITSNQPEKSSNPKSSQSKKKSSKSNKRVSNSTNSNEKQESTEKNVPEKLILPFSFTSTFDKELASPSPSSGLASNSEISRVKLSAESEQRILNLLSSEGNIDFFKKTIIRMIHLKN